ncbi:MAG: hypothetical protein CMJ83_05840 [Planctomycetes bacterium]|nr:hypothetical protein [Planctomycetota bacterium]
MQIRINLLPPENRKKEMTPLATLLPALVSLTIVLGAGAFWAFNHYGELANTEAKNDQATERWKTKQGPLDYLGDLKAEESDYQARAKTLSGIANSRLSWTKKLDELSDLVAEDDDGDRFMVWLQTFEVKPGASNPRSKKKEGDLVTITGLCFSDDHPLNRFNNFHEGVQAHEFYRSDFASINKPAGQAVAMDDDMEPDQAWTVNLALVMNVFDPKAAAKRSIQADRGSEKIKNGQRK